MKSTYVKTISIISVVYCSLGIIGSFVGLLNAKAIPVMIAEPGAIIPPAVYSASYALFGFLLFNYLLMLFLSICFLVLNDDGKEPVRGHITQTTGNN